MKQRNANLFRRGTVEEKMYHVWYNMVDRCHNPWHPAYNRYGRKGILVCPEWRDFKVFLEWAKISYEKGLWLDRENNAEGYNQNNCRWLTPNESRDNTPRTCRITAFNETKTAAEWSRDPRCKVNRDTLRARIKYGYPGELAIATPAGQLK